MLLHAFDASCVAVVAGAGERLKVLQGQIGEEGLVGSDRHTALDFAEKVQVDLVRKGFGKCDVAEYAGGCLLGAGHGKGLSMVGVEVQM